LDSKEKSGEKGGGRSEGEHTLNLKEEKKGEKNPPLC